MSFYYNQNCFSFPNLTVASQNFFFPLLLISFLNTFSWNRRSANDRVCPVITNLGQMVNTSSFWKMKMAKIDGHFQDSGWDHHLKSRTPVLKTIFLPVSVQHLNPHYCSCQVTARHIVLLRWVSSSFLSWRYLPVFIVIRELHSIFCCSEESLI